MFELFFLSFYYHLQRLIEAKLKLHQNGKFWKKSS